MIDKALTLANQYDMSLYIRVIEKIKEAIKERTCLNDQFSDNIALLISKFPDFKQDKLIPTAYNEKINSSNEISEISKDGSEDNKGTLFSNDARKG